MGNSIFNSLFKGLWSKEVRILIVGLDSAGKTTLLYKMKLGEVVQTIPTIGFNVETIQYKNLNITAWDVGGGRSGSRALQRHYYQNTDAIMFVLDSNDRERIQEAKEDIWKMMKEDELRNCPLLIYANKQDIPNAMSVSEITDKLELHSIKDRGWYVQSSCMPNGDGIYEGVDWLANTLKNGFTKQSKIQQNNVKVENLNSKRWWFF